MDREATTLTADEPPRVADAKRGLKGAQPHLQPHQLLPSHAPVALANERHP